LPGLGLVGKIAADHMVSELKAKKLGSVYSPSFPPQVVIQQDGGVEMMKNEFYYWKAEKDGQRDLLFIVGDHQGSTPESHYELCSKILEVAEMYGTSLIYTLGGYGTGSMSRKPKVFGAVNDKALMKQLKDAGVSFEKTSGGIVGAAGLLLGLGRLRNIKAACLMGETHGQIIDARSAKSVLEVLQQLLKVELDLSKLEDRAKKTEKMIESARKREEEQRSFSTPAQEGPNYIR
jgi:hypothetical protein